MGLLHRIQHVLLRSCTGLKIDRQYCDGEWWARHRCRHTEVRTYYSTSITICLSMTCSHDDSKISFVLFLTYIYIIYIRIQIRFFDSSLETGGSIQQYRNLILNSLNLQIHNWFTNGREGTRSGASALNFRPKVDIIYITSIQHTAHMNESLLICRKINHDNGFIDDLIILTLGPSPRWCRVDLRSR